MLYNVYVRSLFYIRIHSRDTHMFISIIMIHKMISMWELNWECAVGLQMLIYLDIDLRLFGYKISEVSLFMFMQKPWPETNGYRGGTETIICKCFPHFTSPPPHTKPLPSVRAETNNRDSSEPYIVHKTHRICIGFGWCSLLLSLWSIMSLLCFNRRPSWPAHASEPDLISTAVTLHPFAKSLPICMHRNANALHACYNLPVATALTGIRWSRQQRSLYAMDLIICNRSMSQAQKRLHEWFTVPRVIYLCSLLHRLQDSRSKKERRGTEESTQKQAVQTKRRNEKNQCICWIRPNRPTAQRNF